MRAMLVCLLMVGCGYETGGPYEVEDLLVIECLERNWTHTYDDRVEEFTEWRTLEYVGTPGELGRARVFLCDREDFGPAPRTCPAGAECTGDIPWTNNPSCIITHPAMQQSQLYVQCGWRKVVTPTGGEPTVTGWRYTSVGWVP